MLKVASGMLGEQFANSAIGLIDSYVCVGVRARVRIGNGDSAKRLPTQNPRFLAFYPVRGVESKGSIGVPMGPTVDGDSSDVRSGVKACAAQHAAQLITNAAFEFGERGLEKFGASCAILIPDRQPGLARRSEHEKNGRFFRFARKFVVADADRKIERGVSMKAPWGDDLVDTEP